MANFIIAAVLLIMIGAAVRYIIKEKKRGVKCIGCPAAGEGSCHSMQGQAADCSCGCGRHFEVESLLK